MSSSKERCLPERRDSILLSDELDSDEFSSPFLSDVVDLSGGDVKVIPYELRRSAVSSTPENPNGLWESIKVGSLDWRQTEKLYPQAVVVRVSAIVSAKSNLDDNVTRHEEIVRDFKAMVGEYPSVDSALHVVCMFKEFSVAENAPLRFTANFWFIFPELARTDPEDFETSIGELLPSRCISYVTFEMLTSFLSRREYEAKLITPAEARLRLQNHLYNSEPCSSLFLKLSPECPDFCRQLLLNISPGSAKYLAGVRAVHKLAVSCTSSQMNSQHNYNETLTVMKLGVDSKDWSFVVFKTLTRLATKNDRSRKINPLKTPLKSHVCQMLELVDASNLQFVEKLAIRIIAKDYRSPPASDSRVQELVDFLFSVIISPEDNISDAEFSRLASLIDDGAPSVCHLTGVLLEKCVEQENFFIGWKIASTISSVNEHTIEEIVTLCSKAFFKYSRTDKGEANRWFDRVFWCVERHYKLLGKYPSGLALHVAAHRGDFDLCWKWFNSKREEKSFRFTAHHTSSIFKAATYAKDPHSHMDEVVIAYKMTPHKEKSPFVFEPLFHLWGIAEKSRDENWAFWEIVHRDLKHYLDNSPSNSGDDNTQRKVRKLAAWLSNMDEWRSGSSASTFSNSSRKLVRRTVSTSGIEASIKHSGLPARDTTPNVPNPTLPKLSFLRRRCSDSVSNQSLETSRSEGFETWRRDVECEETKEPSSPVSWSSRSTSGSPSDDKPLLKHVSSSHENVMATSGSIGSLELKSSKEPVGLFSRNFTPFSFARDDRFTLCRSGSAPERFFESQNPDPVFIPPQRNSLQNFPSSAPAQAVPPKGVDLGSTRFSLPLHLGVDRIWSSSHSSFLSNLSSKESHSSSWNKSDAGIVHRFMSDS